MFCDPDDEPIQELSSEETLAEVRKLAAEDAEMYNKHIADAPLGWVPLGPVEGCLMCSNGEWRDMEYVTTCGYCRGTGARAVVRVAK